MNSILKGLMYDYKAELVKYADYMLDAVVSKAVFLPKKLTLAKKLAYKKPRMKWKRMSYMKRRKYLIRKYRMRKLYKRALVKRMHTLVSVAKMFVNISRNNTHITITALDRNNLKRSVISSAGNLLGIKGTKRSTPLATEMVVKRSLYMLKKYHKHARLLHVYRSGAGRSRSVVMKAIIASRMKVKLRRDVTSIPHNGTRKKSKRRV